MNEYNLKEHLDRLEKKLNSIESHVTNLRIEQKGLQVKSSLFGVVGGILAAIPVLIAAILKNSVR